MLGAAALYAFLKPLVLAGPMTQIDLGAGKLAAKATATPGARNLRIDLAVALGVVALALIAAAGRRFAMLWDLAGDNDSLLRMVEVRDLLGGQGWYDLMQYRLGLAGGLEMHWSRLVDAPIALIILLAQGLGLSADSADLVAMVTWPMLLLAIAAFAIMRIARLVLGDGAAFPAAVIGGLALLTIGIFTPGRVDHHNMQLVLVLLMVWGLVSGTLRGGFGAGAAAALSIAVGLETLPYIAIAGVIAALPLLFKGQPQAARAIGFGLGMAAASVVAFLATVPSAHWGRPVCDAFSVTHLALMVPAGLGLAAIAAYGRLGFAGRLVSGVALGALLAAVAILFFPQCIGDPVVLDPMLKRLWLDRVSEAQPITSLLHDSPGSVAMWFATPALALVIALWRAISGKLSASEAMLAALLAGAFAVSLWQVRGGQFAVPLAAIFLAGWVTRERARTPVRTLAMLLVWIVSINGVWAAVGVALVPDEDIAAADGGPVDSTAVAQALKCYSAQDYVALAALPAQTVMGVSNLGSPVIRYTLHRALSGPYHRNIDANLLTLRTFLGTVDEAQDRMRQAGATLLVHCPGNSESRFLAREAPDGLMAALLAGSVPDWLEEVGPPDAPLRIFQVRR